MIDPSKFYDIDPDIDLVKAHEAARCLQYVAEIQCVDGAKTDPAYLWVAVDDLLDALRVPPEAIPRLGDRMVTQGRSASMRSTRAKARLSGPTHPSRCWG